MDLLAKIQSLSTSGMSAQTDRLRHVSENIANADTPGYHRKLSAFEQVYQAGRPTGEVVAGDTMLDQTALERVYDPAHPMADGDGYYQGSNVNLIVEIADAREAQRSYEANLKMFDHARQMKASLLDLLKR